MSKSHHQPSNAEPPAAALTASRALLILDLDETLIFGTQTPLEGPPDLMVGPYGICFRPHLAEFIATVVAHFRLAVWTVATHSYAAPIVNAIFPPEVRLEFLWCRDRCKRRYDCEAHEEYWLKDLKKLKPLGFNLDRVLFVDDTARNLERNYGNHLAIAAYTGAPEDAELPALANYLVKVAAVPNLRAIEKRGWRKEVTEH